MAVGLVVWIRLWRLFGRRLSKCADVDEVEKGRRWPSNADHAWGTCAVEWRVRVGLTVVRDKATLSKSTEGETRLVMTSTAFLAAIWTREKSFLLKEDYSRGKEESESRKRFEGTESKTDVFSFARDKVERADRAWVTYVDWCSWTHTLRRWRHGYNGSPSKVAQVRSSQRIAVRSERCCFHTSCCLLLTTLDLNSTIKARAREHRCAPCKVLQTSITLVCKVYLGSRGPSPSWMLFRRLWILEVCIRIRWLLSSTKSVDQARKGRRCRLMNTSSELSRKRRLWVPMALSRC